MSKQKVDDTQVAISPTAESGSVSNATRTTTGTPLPSSHEVVPPIHPHLLTRNRSRYEVVAEHGRGGLGRVMRARDKELARDVAIKEILHDDRAGEARFIREAMITARLEHPGIVPVHDAGRWEDGTPFYSMKLVAGRPLKELIKDAPTLKRRLALLPNVMAVAEAIAYAHSRRIIHRDLKPSNIIVGDFGETVVIDWGLAKDLLSMAEEPIGPSAASDGDASLTRVGAVLGTPAYMPPEQARGVDVAEPADIYALGAVLYHVLTGTPPHAPEGARDRAIDVLSTREPEVAPELAAIVSKAMQPDPARRYASAEQLVEDLRRYQTGQLVSAHRYGAIRLLGRWMARNRVPIAGFVVLLAAVVGLLLVNQRITLKERTARKAEQDASASALALRKGQLAQFQELGRLALLAGDPLRAMPYLSEAYSAGVDTPALRLLIARALEESPVATLTHDGWVVGVDVSPDGTKIVTCGADGRMRLWNAAGAKLAEWTGFGEVVWACHFSPDGTRLLVGGSDGTAAIVDVASGTKVASWKADPVKLYAATWAPDGSLVATAGKDGHARLFDANSGALRFDLGDGKDGPIRGVVFSRDGSRLLDWGIPGDVVHVWDLRIGRRLAQLRYNDAVRAATFDASGALVFVAAEEGPVIAWDVVSQRPLLRLDEHTGPVNFVEVSPDGKQVLTASSDHTARLWDARSGRRLVVLEGSAGQLAGAHFSRDGTRVLTFGKDGWARLHDVVGGQVLQVMHGHAGAVASATFLGRGDRAVTASYDGTARLWALDGREMLSFGASTTFVRAALTPDDRQVITASRKVEVWDASDGAHRRALLPDIKFGASIAISRDGQRVAIGTDEGVVVAELASGALVSRFSHGSIVGTVAFSPDGTRVVEGGRDGMVHVFAAADARLLVTKAVGEPVEQVGFSPDGRTVSIASRSREAHVILVDAATGELRPTAGAFTGVNVAFDSTGTRLVTSEALEHNIARVRELPSGRLLMTTGGHDDELTASIFSPDGTMIATSSRDGTVHLWDVESGALLSIIAAGRGVVTGMQFDSTNSRLLTFGWDGVVRLWKMPRPAPSPEALARITRCRAPYRIEEAQLLSAKPDVMACRPAAAPVP